MQTHSSNSRALLVAPWMDMRSSVRATRPRPEKVVLLSAGLDVLILRSSQVIVKIYKIIRSVSSSGPGRKKNAGSRQASFPRNNWGTKMEARQGLAAKKAIPGTT